MREQQTWHVVIYKVQFIKPSNNSNDLYIFHTFPCAREGVERMCRAVTVITNVDPLVFTGLNIHQMPSKHNVPIWFPFDYFCERSLLVLFCKLKRTSPERSLQVIFRFYFYNQTNVAENLFQC